MLNELKVMEAGRLLLKNYTEFRVCSLSMISSFPVIVYNYEENVINKQDSHTITKCANKFSTDSADVVHVRLFLNKKIQCINLLCNSIVIYTELSTY